jgi:hypothetical protein
MAVSEEDRQKWNELHNRLISGDVTVSSEIAEYFMPLLNNRLNNKFHNIDDPHLVQTAINDTLYDYLTRPIQYDPRRSTLFNYLTLKAVSDLKNYLEQGKKDLRLANLVEIVELEGELSVYGVDIADDVDLEGSVINKLSPVWDHLSKVIPDKTDQEIVLMMMYGIRETDLFVKVLGIQNLAKQEQFRLVKQNKDRLKKVIQRHISIEELRDE